MAPFRSRKVAEKRPLFEKSRFLPVWAHGDETSAAQINKVFATFYSQKIAFLSAHRPLASNRYGLALVVCGSMVRRCAIGGKARDRQSGLSQSRQDRPMPTAAVARFSP